MTTVPDVVGRLGDTESIAAAWLRRLPRQDVNDGDVSVPLLDNDNLDDSPPAVTLTASVTEELIRLLFLIGQHRLPQDQAFDIATFSSALECALAMAPSRICLSPSK